MNIDPNGPDIEIGHRAPHWSLGSPASSIRKTRSKGGIGGFFRRLRKFPKTIFKGRSHKHKHDVRDTMDTLGDADLAASAGRLYNTEYDDHTDPEQPDDEYMDAPSMPVPELPVIPGPPPSRSAGMSLHPGDTAVPSRTHSRTSHRSRTPVPHRAPTPSEALSARLRSPIHTEPLLRPPDVRKPTASRRISSAPSVLSQVFRFDKFFRDLKGLPWVSTRITVDYVPGEGRRSHRKVTHKALKSPGSWYTHPRHSLDLLSSGGSGSVRSPYSHPSRGRNSTPSLSSGYPSPTSIRWAKPRTRSHDPYRRYGRGYPVYPPTYPAYPFGYSPQPLFVMQPPPTQVNSPPAALQQTPDAQSTPVFPELCQAVPVYMMSPSTGSPPVIKPMHERKHSKKQSRDHRHPEVHPYPLSIPGHPPPQTSS